MEEILFPKPKLHLFVCVNQRPPDHPTPSCGPRITAEEVKEIKQWIRENGLATQVYCTKVQCLGFCNAQSSVAVLYPQGQFFTYQEKKELIQVLEKEISKL